MSSASEDDATIAVRLESLVSRTAMENADEEHLREVRELVGRVQPRHLTHRSVRALERHQLPVPSALSFQAIMVEQSEARKLGVYIPAWEMNHKANAYAFMDRIGHRRPKTTPPRPLESIAPRAPMVVKPLSGTGGRGVYLVFDEHHMRHVRNGATFDSWAAMTKHARRLMAGKRQVKDLWLTEELILEAEATAGRNFKFYAFYGQVALILESRRDPEPQTCFWLPDGRETSTGRDEETRFEGIGVTPAQVEQVVEISRQIPVPYVRIDMLLGRKELVFGEFTPRPGRFQTFNADWDRLLAEEWVKAEGRLAADLIGGKRFKAFKKTFGADAG